MGTRSYIVFEDAGSKEVVGSYCHYDGDLEYNGKMLLNHYDTETKAKQLAASGYMSSLDKDFKEIDRANKDTAFKYKNLYCLMHELGNDIHLEYVYVWMGGAWYVSEMKFLWSKDQGSVNDASKGKIKIEDIYEDYLAYHTRFKRVTADICKEQKAA